MVIMLSTASSFAFFSDMSESHWAYKQIKDLSEQKYDIIRTRFEYANIIEKRFNILCQRPK